MQPYVVTDLRSRICILASTVHNSHEKKKTEIFYLKYQNTLECFAIVMAETSLAYIK